MDIDATQAMDFELEEEEVRNQLNNNNHGDAKRPVATLRKLTQNGSTETSFSIFKGSNVIGRGTSIAQINLTGKGVSKKHAIIEVDGDTHMVYDLNSRNKTRKGNMILKPEVRYELKDGDVLTFGDIICSYSKCLQNVDDDSGSETGSESLLPRGTPTPPLLINDSDKDDDKSREDSNKRLLSENKTSTPFNEDQPSSVKNACSSSLAKGLILQSDSEEDSFLGDVLPSSIPPKRGNYSGAEGFLVPETPNTDENSRNENQGTDKKCSNDCAAVTTSEIPQFHLDSETDEDNEDEVSALMEAPTQVYPLDEISTALTEKVGLKKNTDQMSANVNQPVTPSKKPAVVVQNVDTIDWMDLPTQPYVLENENVDKDDNDEETVPKENAAETVTTTEVINKVAEIEQEQKKTKPCDSDSSAQFLCTDDWSNMPTQVFPGATCQAADSEDDWSNLPTQVFPGAACEAADNEDDVFNSPATKCPVETDKKVDCMEVNYACVDTVPIDEIELDKLNNKTSEENSSPAEDNGEMMFTSPCSDEDLWQVKKDVQKVIESPALSSQQEPTSKSSKSDEFSVVRSNSLSAKGRHQSPTVTKRPETAARSPKLAKKVSSAAADLHLTCGKEVVDGSSSELSSTKTQPSSVLPLESNKTEHSLEEPKSTPSTRLTRKRTQTNSTNKKDAATVKTAVDESVETKSKQKQPLISGETMDSKTRTAKKQVKQSSTSEAAVKATRSQDESPKTLPSPIRPPRSTARQRRRRIISSEEEDGGTEIACGTLDSKPTNSGKVAKMSEVSTSASLGTKDSKQTFTRLTRASRQSNSPNKMRAVEVTSNIAKPKDSVVLQPNFEEGKDVDLESTGGKNENKSSKSLKIANEVENSENAGLPSRVSNQRSLSTAIKKLKGKILGDNESKNSAVTSDDEPPNAAKTYAGNSKASQPSESVLKQRGRRARKTEIPSELEVVSTEESDSNSTMRQSRRVAKKKKSEAESSLLGTESNDVKSPLKSTPDSGMKRANTRKASVPLKRVRAADAVDKTLQETPAATKKPSEIVCEEKTPKLALVANEDSDTDQSKTRTGSQTKGTAVRLSTRNRLGVKPDSHEASLTTDDIESKVTPTSGRASARNSVYTVKVSRLVSSKPESTSGTRSGSKASKGREPDDPLPSPVAVGVSGQSKRTSKRRLNVPVLLDSDEELDPQISQHSVADSSVPAVRSPVKKQKVQQRSTPNTAEAAMKEDPKTALPSSRRGRRSAVARMDSPLAETLNVGRRGRSLADSEATASKKPIPNRRVLDIPSVEDANEVEEEDEFVSIATPEKTVKPKRSPKSTNATGRKVNASPKPVGRRSRTKGDAAAGQLESDDGRFTVLLPKSPTGQRSRGSSALQECNVNLEPKEVPKIMFTGISENQLEKIVESLKGELVDSIFDCTHLVTDKVRRTWKFLCLLARGCYIVTPTWLHECKAAKKFIDASPYIVKDDTAEAQYQFCLRESIPKASKKPFLQGLKVHTTRNVVPKPQEMQTIIECAGGKFLARMPVSGSGIVVVTCPKDYALCNKARSAGIPVVGTEFILTGVLRQEAVTDEYLC